MIKNGFLRFCDDPELACCRAERDLEQLREENAQLRSQLQDAERRERATEEFETDYAGSARDKAVAAWNRRTEQESELPASSTPTNAQRIRGMADEELAEFLWEQNGNNRYWKSVGKYLDWLKQPAEMEGME